MSKEAGTSHRWVLYVNWEMVPLGLTCVFMMQSTGIEDNFIRHFFKSHRPDKNVQERTCMSFREICKSATQFSGIQRRRVKNKINKSPDTYIPAAGRRVSRLETHLRNVKHRYFTDAFPFLCQ